jgi:hypothetical protein
MYASNEESELDPIINRELGRRRQPRQRLCAALGVPAALATESKGAKPGRLASLRESRSSLRAESTAKHGARSVAELGTTSDTLFLVFTDASSTPGRRKADHLEWQLCTWIEPNIAYQLRHSRHAPKARTTARSRRLYLGPRHSYHLTADDLAASSSLFKT